MQIDLTCFYCRHFDTAPGDFRCSAFPDGIPRSITRAKTSHFLPWPGDNGIVFELNPKLVGEPLIEEMIEERRQHALERGALLPIERWTFNDGTVFEDGKVLGESVFAHELRYDLELIRNGQGVSVYPFPPPGGMVDLDLDDDWLVHRWLLDRAAKHRLVLVSAPEVTPWSDPRGESTEDPGTVY